MPTTTPQAITERYVSNLIHYGRNKEFTISYIEQLFNKVDGDNCGVYFRCQIEREPFNPTITEKCQKANGATIAQAVRRGLEKHGVTFR